MASITEKKWAQQAALGREKKKLLYCSTFDIEGPFHKKSYNGYSYFSSQIFFTEQYWQSYPEGENV